MKRFGRSWRSIPTRLVTIRRVRLNSVNPQHTDSSTGNNGSSNGRSGGSSQDGPRARFMDTLLKFAEGSATALGSVLVLGIAGYSYHWYYKWLVLRKIENAFSPGFSSLEMAALSRQVAFADSESSEGIIDVDDEDWIQRDEQKVLDGIVNGSIQGQYYLITGEKGTGKTSMLLKSMRKIHGDGIAMLEAHGDLEIFRLRLGKAIDFEYHEDYIGSLFNFRGPRDTTPLLDIERAMNKTEKIALRRREEGGNPLVLIINGAHLLRDDEQGRDLLELIQQRAELWAASHLVTVVLNSDDYWIAERLTAHATRLRIFPVRDIPKDLAIEALHRFRLKTFGEDVAPEILEQAYRKVGGRLRFLSQVGKSTDMLRTCDIICEKEKRWLLSRCWILGSNLDEAAEEEQELCAAAMILAKALVEKAKDMGDDGRLPQIPLHEARQIVTRADIIQHHDHNNILTIDPNTMMVQASSVAMQNAFRAVCSLEGFDEQLQGTLDRLDELESLRRTRELMFKDLQGGSKVEMSVQSADGQRERVVSLTAEPKV